MIAEAKEKRKEDQRWSDNRSAWCTVVCRGMTAQSTGAAAPDKAPETVYPSCNRRGASGRVAPAPGRYAAAVDNNTANGKGYCQVRR